MQVRFCNGVGVILTASLHLQNHLPRQLARSLVSYVVDGLEDRILLCTFRYAQVLNRHNDLTTSLSTLLLLFSNANDLPAKWRHSILRNLDFLWRTPAAVCTRWTARIRAAAAAQNKPFELESLAGHTLVEFLGSYRYHDLQILTAQLALDLRLYSGLLKLPPLLLHLGLKHAALRVVSRHLRQLRIQLSFLTLYLLPRVLNVLDQLDPTQVIVPPIVWIGQYLVCLTHLVEDLGIASLVWVIGDRQPSKLALDGRCVCILLDLKELVQIFRDKIVLWPSSGDFFELQLGLLASLACLLSHKFNPFQFGLVLVVQLLSIDLIQTLYLELDDLQGWRVQQHPAIVCCPQALTFRLTLLQRGLYEAISKEHVLGSSALPLGVYQPIVLGCDFRVLRLRPLCRWRTSSTTATHHAAHNALEHFRWYLEHLAMGGN
mmetsp:Transcript_54441/g.129741  ORF Transcript_54441/g.129741 Transcript_54441/m.129741 type:complete len:432 (-) Transcript_54441:91-1386(-)